MNKKLILILVLVLSLVICFSATAEEGKSGFSSSDAWVAQAHKEKIIELQDFPDDVQVERLLAAASKVALLNNQETTGKCQDSCQVKVHFLGDLFCGSSCSV